MKIPRDKYGHFAKGIEQPKNRSFRIGATPKKEKVCQKCGDKFLGGGTSKYCYSCKGF